MIKVGIVEDNETLREGLQTLIGITDDMECVCACETVKEALEKVPKAEPDVVLMDIQLPDGTGIECTEKIKEMLPSVQIVVITVYDDSVRIFQALKAGASGYLLKRAKPERFIEAVRESQEGGVPMPPEIARKVISLFREQGEAESAVADLTPRETELLEMVVLGLGNKEIAGRMGVSLRTVRFHLQNVYEKLHVHTRTDAALKFKNSQKPGSAAG